MSNDTIVFDDGAAYERYMGVWSRLVGQAFLDWVAPSPNLRWLDVGCGNGAFTQMIVDRCSPADVQGIDPSAEQLAFARSQPGLQAAKFQIGDAMALPFPDDSFDVAVMPLVIFFVPVPAKGVAEMVRVVSPGGTVAAYAWDVVGRAFPYQSLWDALQEIGVLAPVEPSRDASRLDVMRDLWTTAGLTAVETREFTVQRTFASFDEYWTTILGGPSASKKFAAMAPADIATVRSRMKDRLPTDASGRITYSARANAVKGRVG